MKEICICWAISIVLLAVTAWPVRAQEFYILGGVMETADRDHSSYSWQLEYLQGLAEHAAFHRHWDLRTSWNRIVTDYNRDTDIILGGVGYRF